MDASTRGLMGQLSEGKLTTAAIRRALKQADLSFRSVDGGEGFEVEGGLTIYWDDQDSNNVGWAWRTKKDSDALDNLTDLERVLDSLGEDVTEAYDRTAPVTRILDKYWNEVNDLQSELEAAIGEYDAVAMYAGTTEGKAAKAVITALKKAVQDLEDVRKSGGVLDKIQRAEQGFIKKFGHPDIAADKLSER